MSETSLAIVDRAVQIPGVQVSRLGLTFERDLSLEEMGTVFTCLQHITGCSNWLWGDALAFAGNKWGNRYTQSKYEQAFAHTALAIPTLRAARHTAERIPIDRRRAELTYSHHCEIAYSYPDPAVQDQWLDRAIEENWSVPQLRKAIRLDKQEIHEEPNPEPGKYRPVKDHLSLSGWFRKQRFEEWPEEQLEAWFEDLLVYVEAREQIGTALEHLRQHGRRGRGGKR